MCADGESYHAHIMACYAGPTAGVARGPTFSSRAMRLAALPSRYGGAGLTHTDALADAAWAGSWAQSWFHMRLFFPRLLGHVALAPARSDDSSEPSSTQGGIMRSVGEAFARIEAHDTLVMEARDQGISFPGPLMHRATTSSITHPTEYDARSHTRSQSSYAAVVHTSEWLSLRDSLTDPRERAWLLSVSMDSIGPLFMRAIPAFGPLVISPAEFPIAVRHHFMERQPVVAGISQCGACRAHMGVGGDAMHYEECRGSADSGNWYARNHDVLERSIHVMLSQVFPGRGTVLRQDAFGAQGYSPQYLPDLSVLDYDGRGATMVTEVSIFRPTCQTHIGAACTSSASLAVERRRRGDYGALPPSTQWRPFIMDTFGHMSPGTFAFFSELVRRRGDRDTRGRLEPEESMSWGTQWRLRLSVVMARIAAHTIATRARGDFPLQPLQRGLAYHP